MVAKPGQYIWTCISLAACAVPGMVLLSSAVLKALDPNSLTEIADWAGIPEFYQDWLRIVIVGVEGSIGMLLIVDRRSIATRIAALALFGAFTSLLLTLMFVSDPPNYDCFSALLTFQSARSGHMFGIGRNLCLSACILWSFSRDSHVS